MVLRTQAAVRLFSLKRSRVCQSCWVISLPLLMEMKLSEEQHSLHLSHTHHFITALSKCHVHFCSLIHQPSHLLIDLLEVCSGNPAIFTPLGWWNWTENLLLVLDFKWIIIKASLIILIWGIIWDKRHIFQVWCWWRSLGVCNGTEGAYNAKLKKMNCVAEIVDVT